MSGPVESSPDRKFAPAISPKVLWPLLLAALAGAARAAEVDLLRPVAGATPPLALSAPGDDGGRTVAIDRRTLAGLEVGDVVHLEPLPGRRIGYALDSTRAFLNGDIGWHGVHHAKGRTHSLALVHNPRSVLGSFTSPWGVFEISGIRGEDADYAGRLSASAEGRFHGAADDTAPPKRRHPPRPEVVAQTGGGLTLVPTPSGDRVFIGETVGIAVDIANNSAVPVAGAALSVKGLSPHAELAAGPEGCLSSQSSSDGFDCRLPVIEPGAALALGYSLRMLEVPDLALLDIPHDVYSANDRIVPSVSGHAAITVLVDVLADSDGDGQSDFNEGIVGTDPDDPLSVIAPDAVSEIDVAFLYTIRFARNISFYIPPKTRINQAVEEVNAYYANSGVAVAFRPVLYRPVDYAIDGSIRIAHARLVEGDGVFRHVPEMAAAAGADIIVLIGGDWDPGDACAQATFADGESDGHILHSPDLPIVAMYAPGQCHRLVLAHELGHTLGLAHDRRDPSPGDRGTFPWARGHGVEGAFRTIMAPEDNWLGTELLPLFSNPENAGCRDMPCGVPREDPELGADAVFALNHTRFQAAARRESRVLHLSGDAPAGLVMYGAATRGGDPDTPVAAFSPDDDIDLAVTIEVPAEHQGETGELYAVLDAGPGGRYFLDSDRTWRRWPSVDLDTLGSGILPRPMGIHEELAAFDGFVPAEFGISSLSAIVYFAYAVPSLGVLAYTRDGVELLVRPEP